MTTGLDGLWARASDRLQARLGQESFERFFDGARLVEIAGEQAVIALPNDFQQWWLESNYFDIVREAISADTEHGHAVRRVRFTVDTPGLNGHAPSDRGAEPCEASHHKNPSSAAGTETPAPPAHHASASDEVYLKRVGEVGLKPANTFSAFVVGANNRFAHAAAISVGRTPGGSYNPLFLHGGVGLGKTHLMQAIGHKLLRGRRRVRVLYMTSEMFTNEFIEAIRRNAVGTFREKCRRADVLLLDDVQFLGGKERSQEEFFHTFNTLLDGQKQIVLTSDRPASEIKNLEPRLVSRFEWGLTAELQAPDEETRIAILRHKAEQWGVHLPDEIVSFIAAGIRNNIRRLEGALTRLATFASLSGERLTPRVCETMLRDFLQEESGSGITIDAIQRLVAEHFDIRLADMTSKRRPAHIVLPRQIAMYLARELTDNSLAEIGETFGGRDHGTVIHACRRVETILKSDVNTRLAIGRLEDTLKRG
jgi:chromosomal replication initiator protein